LRGSLFGLYPPIVLSSVLREAFFDLYGETAGVVGRTGDLFWLAMREKPKPARMEDGFDLKSLGFADDGGGSFSSIPLAALTNVTFTSELSIELPPMDKIMGVRWDDGEGIPAKFVADTWSKVAVEKVSMRLEELIETKGKRTSKKSKWRNVEENGKWMRLEITRMCLAKHCQLSASSRRATKI
jgi:hypothetical protein